MSIDELKEVVGASEVLFAMTTGSRLYGATNPHDDDLLVVVDKRAKHFPKLEGKDAFVYTVDEFKKSLTEPIYSPLDELCNYLNNQAAIEDIRRSVLYGESPCKNISLYDSPKEVFERVIKFGDKNFFNPCVRNKRGMRGCSKLMSWALWYYYAFENGSLELTKEQQNTIQLCHDGNLPIEYAKELREKIVKLINA